MGRQGWRNPFGSFCGHGVESAHALLSLACSGLTRFGCNLPPFFPDAKNNSESGDLGYLVLGVDQKDASARPTSQPSKTFSLPPPIALCFHTSACWSSLIIVLQGNSGNCRNPLPRT